jgi:hypothetical protein
MGFPSDINPVGREQRVPRGGQQTTFRKVTDVRKATSFPLVEYGYKPDGKKIPEAYLSRVTSLRNKATVVSPLQEDILLKVESQWSPVLPSGMLTSVDQAVQLLSAGNLSIISRATSRRMWRGSSPMRLNLKMRFEAVYDSMVEVVKPIELLGSLVLPIETIKTSKLGFPFLGPPGPAATNFRLTKLANNSLTQKVDRAYNALEGGDQIQIQLGRFLAFTDVIVREVSFVIPIKFDRNNNPVSATINVNFETYEMMTVEGFKGSFING